MDTSHLSVPHPLSLWRSWFFWVTAGEAAGFTVPAVTGVFTRDAPAGVAYAALILAGLVEGAALGWVQAHALSRTLRRLDVRRFTMYTSVGAGCAYAIAMSPTLVGDQPGGWPVVVQVVVGASLGGALLASIGTAQWLVLRESLVHTASWILTTAGAWLVGLGVFLGIATPLWHEGQATWLTVLIGIVAGLVMAAVVAALTGVAMLRLVRRHAQYAQLANPTADKGRAGVNLRTPNSG